MPVATGEFENAIRLLQKYTALVNDGNASAQIYLERGNIHQQLRMLEAALRDYDAALAADPPLDMAELASLYDNGNTCQRELGRLEEAIAAGREAVRLSPETADYHINLAASRFGTRDYQGTLDNLDNALELGADDPSLWSLRGWAHYRSGNFETALSDFNEAIDRDDDSEMYLGRGLVHHALADEIAAQADFDQYRELHPVSPEVASLEIARHLASSPFAED